MATETLIPKEEEKEEKLSNLPVKKLDPEAYLLHAALNGVSKYATSRAKRTIITPSDEPLLNLSATKAAADIRNGKIKSLDLIQAYFKRIKDINPFINAATELFEAEAVELAKEADELVEKTKGKKDKIEQLKKEKPLLGIPVSLKHNLNYKGHRNICGLLHLRSSPLAKSNATCVERVLQAGGIPICYTNVPPGCLSLESDNAVFGRTLSPHDSRTTCGGSSGGEAALIAAQGSLIGIGSDLGGSIRIPSILCGIYGLKPGPTGCPLDGFVPPLAFPPEKRGMCVVGPMVRYAEDLGLLHNVLASTPIPFNIGALQPSKIYSCAPEALPLVRLNREVRHVWEDVRNYLTGTYHLSNNEFKLGKTLPEFMVMLSAMAFQEFDMNEFLSPGEHITVLKEFVKLLTRSSPLSFGALSSYHAFTKKLPQHVINEALKQVQVLRKRIGKLLEDNAILLFPALPETHYFHAAAFPTVCAYTSPFNVLGLPCLAVPCGRDRLGYPLAVQLVGGVGSENLLCAVAEKIEEKFEGWVKPHGVAVEE
ncbi:unnamed protein product [Bursaphelenchus xylophilus]|uniref:(pine wood nematode) hypothetical protein n=1 Tax=Bursaphelenchus xylophilus TaxID=6326 RepID=A0A1I7SKX6_BURXY|nr:unnamed protein product [Bursaphelenchus xylophilus]CAG9129285.1 unnamed protein product [Bursaphelenchus xylophilus]